MEDLFLDSQRHAQDLRETWQARVLAETNGRLFKVMLAVLMHNYFVAMQVLLRVVFPVAPLTKKGWPQISLPIFKGTATIMPDSSVRCDAVMADRSTVKKHVVYVTEERLIREIRDLADRLKLSDRERVEMTESVKRWIVRDMRTIVRPMTASEARAAQREINEIGLS